MTQRSTRHHYVPAFYLRRFADQRGRLDAYNRVTQRRITTSVSNTAVESGLYNAIDVNGEVTDAAEHEISIIESRVAPAFDRLIEEPWPPSIEVRSLVANFVALQVTRTRESLHALAAMHDRTTRWGMSMLTREQWRDLYIDALGEQPTEEELDEVIADFADLDGWQIQPHPNLVVQSIFEGAIPLVEAIASRKWFLQKSRRPLFITSDSPVTMWSSPDAAPYGVGVFTADELSLPIDSTHSLLMVFDTRGFHESQVEITRSQAKRISQFVANSSYEWVYADPRRRVLDTLELPTGPRPLIIFNGQSVWGPGHADR